MCGHRAHSAFAHQPPAHTRARTHLPAPVKVARAGPDVVATAVLVDHFAAAV